MPGTLRSSTISTRRERIAELARAMPQAALTTLAHHIDIEWLLPATGALARTELPGLTGRRSRRTRGSWRTTSGRCSTEPNPVATRLRRCGGCTFRRGPGVRRPGPSASQRFEDKILQRAVAMILEAIYEQDFLGLLVWVSHMSLGASSVGGAAAAGLMEVRGGWVLEIDIRKFFDTMDHGHLHAIVRRRVRDGVLLRLIGKWLKAGVDGGGATSRTPIPAAPRAG